MPQPMPMAVSSWVTAVNLSADVVAVAAVQFGSACASASPVMISITTTVAGTVYFSNVRMA
ncbi:hypothetical protein LUX33_02065 [Actinomadura madurae]|nr:hypothetical protein [Actinomadura madurae]MCP9947374.1 hypothetical protein [Actinomadura madurae]MCP9976614.1 hypothetical protein [Actinomadura madurae]MCQ0011893.1 hypothetical protein [Actinomadura madurae]